LDDLKASTSSGDALRVDAGPDFFLHQATISADFLPPVYSESLPSTKNLRVGYPLTPNLLAVASFYVASTLPRGIAGSADLSSLAAEAYSGVNYLQCPHHGA